MLGYCVTVTHSSHPPGLSSPLSLSHAGFSQLSFGASPLPALSLAPSPLLFPALHVHSVVSAHSYFCSRVHAASSAVCVLPPAERWAMEHITHDRCPERALGPLVSFPPPPPTLPRCPEQCPAHSEHALNAAWLPLMVLICRLPLSLAASSTASPSLAGDGGADRPSAPPRCVFGSQFQSCLQPS